MPFTPIGNGKYQSPSGRTYNAAQVKLWYANGGKFPGEQGPGELPGKATAIKGMRKSKLIAKALMTNGS